MRVKEDVRWCRMKSNRRLDRLSRKTALWLRKLLFIWCFTPVWLSVHLLASLCSSLETRWQIPAATETLRYFIGLGANSPQFVVMTVSVHCLMESCWFLELLGMCVAQKSDSSTPQLLQSACQSVLRHATEAKMTSKEKVLHLKSSTVRKTPQSSFVLKPSRSSGLQSSGSSIPPHRLFQKQRKSRPLLLFYVTKDSVVLSLRGDQCAH